MEEPIGSKAQPARGEVINDIRGDDGLRVEDDAPEVRQGQRVLVAGYEAQRQDGAQHVAQVQREGFTDVELLRVQGYDRPGSTEDQQGPAHHLPDKLFAACAFDAASANDKDAAGSDGYRQHERMQRGPLLHALIIGGGYPGAARSKHIEVLMYSAFAYFVRRGGK